MSPNKLPPLEFLMECFLIDENSPSGLIWKNRPREHFIADYSCNQFNSKYPGKQAGDTLSNYGYWRVGVKYKGKNLRLLCHRLVYFLYHRKDICLSMRIDHIDRNTKNNKVSNLRLVTISENNSNRIEGKNNTSGNLGVYPYKDKWRATIKVKNKAYSLGIFNCFDEAVQARKFAENVKSVKNSSDRQDYILKN